MSRKLCGRIQGGVRRISVNSSTVRVNVVMTRKSREVAIVPLIAMQVLQECSLFYAVLIEHNRQPAQVRLSQKVTEDRYSALSVFTFIFLLCKKASTPAPISIKTP